MRVIFCVELCTNAELVDKHLFLKIIDRKLLISQSCINRADFMEFAFILK